jgi:hypothetical protein
MRTIILIASAFLLLTLSAYVLQETRWAPPLDSRAKTEVDPGKLEVKKEMLPAPLSLEEVERKVVTAFGALPQKGEGAGLADDSRRFHELVMPLQELMRKNSEAEELVRAHLKKCSVENRFSLVVRGLCLSEFRALSKRLGRRPDEMGVPQFLRQQLDRWESPGS